MGAARVSGVGSDIKPPWFDYLGLISRLIRAERKSITETMGEDSGFL
jgi:hypothetical protein